ncbi:hypothetical protein [Burkholderia sp. Ac-20379]|uniref:hypothetical protein n=1 Tax=Burkholderia sp. Ac-20379 TaxID=2703900 RepID=UPI00197F1FEB|nr:hypothetical protein [Burkholderia sp. Ac-20379]MBN3725309.1 hypothetical protein [Burkholderia sp. Ac-20379]
MIKSDYLGSDEVQAFVAWIGARLDDATFAHAYTRRRDGTAWRCGSLYEAYLNYAWHAVALPEYGLAAGQDFASNFGVLDTLQKALRDGLEQGDNPRVLSAAKALMAWGGVTNHNVTWLIEMGDDLCRAIGEVRDAIHSGDTEHPVFQRSELRFTSGMSKIYSLACDDFIIYDSRVAAALCRAVVLFCRETGRSQVPSELRFPWAAAKSGPNAANPPQRNPAEGSYRFPRLRRGRYYASWNMKASWLLAEIASQREFDRSAFSRLGSKTQQMRAMEAALFMFGYDLADGPIRDSDADTNCPPPGAWNMAAQADDAPREDAWTQCWTPARRIPFEYRLAAATAGIQTRAPDGTSPFELSDQQLNATLQSLNDKFEDRPFPLANDVVLAANDDAPKGLGAVLKQATKESPGFASRLAAVLESIDVFIAQPRQAGGRHWRLNRELLDVSGSGRVDLRPYLDALIQGD